MKPELQGMLIFSLFVHGKPQSRGSKRPVGHHGRLIDSNPKSRAWMDQVAWEVRALWGGKPLLTDPLWLDLRFELLRPKCHFGAKGAVKRSAPSWPAVKPDRLKLSRAVEDALTGTLYRDDAQVVCGEVSKVYSERQGVLIECRYPIYGLTGED